MEQFNASSAVQQQVSACLDMMGFDHYGFAPLREPLTFALYESWIAEGHHGQMEYMARHAPVKKSPKSLLARARSAIVIAFHYIPHPEPLPESPISSLRVAFYARGKDYHHWLKDRLASVIERLKTIYPDEQFLAVTDSSPLMERDLAYQAGLGWFGKNTCAIDQKRGSFFLLGEIISTLDFNPNGLPATEPHPNRCGTCTKCIDACPTHAIIEEKKLDARKCISYLTIESKTAPPVELREKMGDNFFGCDICQSVCPWNEKVYGELVKQEASPILKASLEVANDLRFILKSSNKVLEKKFKGTPLSRARGFGLKRNALVVAANLGLSELKSEISFLENDERLGELAKWALNRLATETANGDM